MFQQLLDPENNRNYHDTTSKQMNSTKDDSGTMSKSELMELVEQYDQEDKEQKAKRKKKRDPSVKEVREHLRTIIQYHEKEVEKSIPSIYPVLGACGEDSSDDDAGDHGGDPGGSGTGKEGRVFKAAANQPRKKNTGNKKSSGRRVIKMKKPNGGKKKR